MKSKYLTDNFEIDTSRVYTDEGFLMVPATLAKTGTQEYFAHELGLTDRDPTDVIVVYRPPEEVFSEDSLKSFAGKPVTDGHPPVLVNSENSTQYAKGAVISDVTKNGDYVEAMLSIFDATLIEKINSGKVEISNGYKTDITMESGVSPAGVAYDAVQRTIKGNHIAVVNKGRAGENCRLSDHDKGALKMPIVINDVKYETSNQSLVDAVSVLQKALEDAENAVAKMESEKSDMEKKKQAELDKKQAEVDDAKAQIMSDAAIDEVLADRIEVISTAMAVIDGFDFKGKTTMDMKREVIVACRDGIVLDGKSDDYVNAAYDLVSTDSGDNAMDHVLRSVVKKDSSDPVETVNIVDEARKKFIASARDQHKGEK